MRNKRDFMGILGLLLVFALIVCGCPNPTDGTNQTPIPDPPNTSVLITYEVILDNLYKELIQRVDGEVETPELATTSNSEYAGEEMGQIANCQYICNAINAYANKNFQPAAGTAQQVANIEYLLKQIDKANNNSTSYGTGTYATKQVVDTVAINNALKLVILFQTQTWSEPGEYAIELPAGIYEVTMMSARNGNMRMWGKYFDIEIESHKGAEGKTTISIDIWTSIIVVVGGHGSNGTKSSVGIGGTPGNGQNGVHTAEYVEAETIYSNSGGTGGASGIKNICHVPGGYYEVNGVPQGTSISNNPIQGISNTKDPYVIITRM
jgi:hypothetical protein